MEQNMIKVQCSISGLLKCLLSDFEKSEVGCWSAVTAFQTALVEVFRTV